MLEFDILLNAKNYLRCICVSLYLCLSSVHAETLQVAVASNFILPAQEIAQLFEKESGNQIKISSGSTGKFFAQIKMVHLFMFFSLPTHKRLQN